MTRYRKIFFHDGREPVEAKEGAPGKPAGPQIMRDQAGFQSVIDGTWVEGKAAVREHERKHGVFQVGNDISNKIRREIQRNRE